jgi:hypothetical protein
MTDGPNNGARASLLKLPAAPVVFQEGGASEEQGVGRISGGRRLLEANERGAVVCPIYFECGGATAMLDFDQLSFETGEAHPMQETVRDLPVRIGERRLRSIVQKLRITLRVPQPLKDQRFRVIDERLGLRTAGGFAHAAM